MKDLEERLEVISKKYKDGVHEDVLKLELFDGIDITEMADTINVLLKSGVLKVVRVGNSLVYKLGSKEEKNKKFHGLSDDELTVYKIIEKADNKGIWSRDIRYATRFMTNQIQKILRVLENRRLIKFVKSVKSKNKKLYMLFDLTPSEEVTGGAWYSEQEFDLDFVEVLRNQCVNIIQEKEPVNIKEIWDIINHMKISNVFLKVENIRDILNSLQYDGLIEKVEVEPGAMEERAYGGPSSKELEDGYGRMPVVSDRIASSTYYSMLNQIQTHNHCTNAPCFSCELASVCEIGNADISPTNCQYFKMWLEKENQEGEKD